jgi:hypothetical protein
MTTDYGGPASSIPEYPSHRIGVTPFAKYMDHQSNLGQNSPLAGIPVTQVREDMHDIGSLQIVVMPDPNSHKHTNFNQSFAPQSYGKPLAIGQAGNLPHGLSEEFMASDYWKSLTPEEKARLKRECARRNVVMLGVSVDSYRKMIGPDHTPEHDGISVIMHGPCTVRIYTPEPLRPMSQLVLDLIPSQAGGRGGSIRYQSDGPEKYPFTFKEHSPRTTRDWAIESLRYFSERIGQKKVKDWVFLNKIDTFGNSTPMLETDKNGQDLTMGILQLSLVVIEVLIEKERLSFEGGSGVNGWKEKGTSVLGLARVGDSVEAQDSINLVQTILNRLTNRATPLGGARVGSPDYDTHASNGLQTFLNGMQGIAASTNQIVARNIGTRPQKYGKNQTGMHEYDVFIHAV